ncbi:MAG: GIY-YIG nuclease family protein [Leeuwenhoekiella sp.]
MIYIILNTVSVSARKQVVVQISLLKETPYESEEQHFLIRPNISIKKELLQSCGIDKTTLLQASPFCDIANELIEIIGDSPVSFLTNYQYRLFVSEFKVIGYTCNIKYQSLDNVFKSLKISSEGIDASGLLKVLSPEDFALQDDLGVFKLQKCYKLIADRKDASQQHEPSNPSALVKINITAPLLKKPGVYYFKNAGGEIIYVGKAKKVKNRLQSHFSNSHLGNRALYTEVTSIDIEYTGSDLIAQLLESQKIKHFSPKFNFQQVKTPVPYDIVIKTNKQGVKRFVIERKTYEDSQGERYYNRDSAKARLQELCVKYTLCPKFCSLERKAGACTASLNGGCLGICTKNEGVAVYNSRVDLAYKALQLEADHKIIKVSGRRSGEFGFVLITNGIYQGFGFCDGSVSISTLNDLEGYLQRYHNNYDTNRIIGTLLKTTPKKQIFVIQGGF